MSSSLKSKVYMDNLEKVRKKPGHLAYIEDQSEEMCLEAVKINGLSLYYAKVKTPAIYAAAIKENPHALNFIEDQTEDLCRLAIQEDGLSIQFVDKKTPSLCLTAVQQNGSALSHIPKELWTDELCMEAITQDPTILQLIDNQTEAMCIVAVSKNPEAIMYVQNQTGSIIKAAITKQNLTNQNFVQGFIDFKKFNIASIKNMETGEVYTFDDKATVTSISIVNPIIKLGINTINVVA